MVSQFGSLGYTIMRKTADLTVVQKTIIDTLHKEGKPQTCIAKEAGCSQSAVSMHINRMLNGRKKCGRKRCTTNRENVSGYVCNHGSPNGERDTASPRGRYGERPQRDSCLKIHM